MTLPGSDAAVFVHARASDGTSRLVGRYRLRGGGVGEFAYAGSWLRDSDGTAFPLDPEHLPLKPGPFAATRRGLLPGALADATPDRWGRRLVEAAHAGRSFPMTAADWLLATGDERVGCLAFSRTPEPPAPVAEFARYDDLDAIACGFERLISGEPVPGLVERLCRAGHSLGGAPPKAAVSRDGALWIAKFQRRDDDYDQCAAEHAAMRLSALCGIDAAETRLVEVGFGLSSERAAEIVEGMTTAMLTWRDHFSDCGVDALTIRRLEPAFSRTDAA